MNRTPKTHEPRGQWLTTGEAAAALHVTPKTVRRRIERGELEARKVARDGGGIVWLVQIGVEVPSEKDSEADTERTSDAHRKGHGERVTDTETPSEKDMGVERKGHETDTDLTAHLLEEVKFLRATVEQLQRDGAEVRAALRAALKLTGLQSAPMLEAGTPEPRDGQQTSAAANAATTVPEAVKSPAKRQGGPLTYDDIADEIERNMRK